MKRLIVVGHDVAPCGGLSAIAKELEGRFDVTRFLANGKDIAKTEAALNSNEDVRRGDFSYLSEVMEACLCSDVIVTGCSSSDFLSREEALAMRIAKMTGKPLVVYADTFKVYRAPWFEFARNAVSLAFVQSEDDCKDASGYFPNARVVVTGSPVIEAAFYPPTTRAEVNARLGLSDDTRMVLVSTAKEFKENEALLKPVLQAMRVLGQDYVLTVSSHPGDLNDKGSYQKWADEAGVPMRLYEKGVISSQELLPRADVVITGGSAIAIEAACQRIPVIDFLSEGFLKRMQEKKGTSEWEREEMGIARAVYDPEQIAGAIRGLLSIGGFDSMHRAQEKYYPHPTHKGEAAEKMAAEILSLLGS